MGLGAHSKAHKRVHIANVSAIMWTLQHIAAQLAYSKSPWIRLKAIELPTTNLPFAHLVTFASHASFLKR